MRIEFSVSQGFDYDVEISTNLVDWQLLHGLFFRTADLITVDVPLPLGPGQRFYRARLESESE